MFLLGNTHSGVNICLYAPTNVGERFLKFAILGKSFDLPENHLEKLFYKNREIFCRIENQDFYVDFG